MNIIKELYTILCDVVGNIVTALSKVNSVFIDVLNLIVTGLNSAIDALRAIESVPLIGSLLSPVISPLVAILSVIKGILYASKTLLDMLQNIYDWIKNNLSAATYLGILMVLALLTQLPITSALIFRLPTPILALLFLVPLSPGIVYMYNSYILNLDSSIALQEAENTAFNALPFMLYNFDIVIYFTVVGFILIVLQDQTIYQTLKEALPRVLFMDLLALIIGITALPLLFLAYYYYALKINVLSDAIQKVRRNMYWTCLSNLDILVYGFVGLNLFLILTDESSDSSLREALPEYMYMNFKLTCIMVLVIPMIIAFYFSVTKGITIFEAIGNVRDVVYSIASNISNIFSIVFKFNLPKTVVANSDPNPGLKPAERLFFAQLFGDDIQSAPYNDLLQYPFYKELSSTDSPMPLKSVSFVGSYSATGPGLFGRMAYEDLNQEFYNDQYHQKSVYYSYFKDYKSDGQTEQGYQYMSRIQYIALPYTMLTDQSYIISAINNLVFDCLNINKTNFPNVYSVADIPDSVIKGYATGSVKLDTEELKVKIRGYAANGSVFAVKNFLAESDQYSYDQTNKYSDVWIQNYCLQVANWVPGNLYQLAYKAIPGGNVANLNEMLKTNLLNITIGGQTLAQNPIAFWNYAYAAAQQSGITGITGTNANKDRNTQYYNVYEDTKQGLYTAGVVAVATDKICRDYLVNNPSNRELFLKTLYREFTGQEVPNNVSVYELAYKSLTSTRQNMKNYNADQGSITDTFTNKLYAKIESNVSAKYTSTNEQTARVIYSSARRAAVDSNLTSAIYDSWSAGEITGKYLTNNAWYNRFSSKWLTVQPFTSEQINSIGSALYSYNPDGFKIWFNAIYMSIQDNLGANAWNSSPNPSNWKSKFAAYLQSSLDTYSILCQKTGFILKDLVKAEADSVSLLSASMGVPRTVIGVGNLKYDSFNSWFNFSQRGRGAYHNFYTFSEGIFYQQTNNTNTKYWYDLLQATDVDGAFCLFASKMGPDASGNQNDEFSLNPYDLVFFKFVDAAAGSASWNYTRTLGGVGSSNSNLEAAQLWLQAAIAMDDLHDSGKPFSRSGWANRNAARYSSRSRRYMFWDMTNNQMTGMTDKYFTQWWIHRFLWSMSVRGIHNTHPNNAWNPDGYQSGDSWIGTYDFLAVTIENPQETTQDKYRECLLHAFFNAFMNTDRGSGAAYFLSGTWYRAWFKAKYSDGYSGQYIDYVNPFCGFGSYLVMNGKNGGKADPQTSALKYIGYLNNYFGAIGLYYNELYRNASYDHNQLFNYANAICNQLGNSFKTIEKICEPIFVNQILNLSWSSLPTARKWVDNLGFYASTDHAHKSAFYALMVICSYDENSTSTELNITGVITNTVPSSVQNVMIGASNVPWFTTLYQNAYYLTFINIIQDPANITGMPSTLSNRNNWNNSWVYRFMSYSGCASVDYEALFKESFEGSLNGIDSAWLTRFYESATGTSLTMNTYLQNVTLYRAVDRILSSWGTNLGPTTSGNAIENVDFRFREDMPDSIFKLFVPSTFDQTQTLNSLCTKAFNNILTYVFANEVYSVTWPYAFLKVIGPDKLPANVSIDYNSVYRTAFYNVVKGVTTIPGISGIGGDARWLARFYNLITNKSNWDSMGLDQTLTGNLWASAFDAASTITLDLKFSVQVGTQVSNVSWIPYFFINSADQLAFQTAKQYVCYGADKALKYGDTGNAPWPSQNAQKKLWPTLYASNNVLQPLTTGPDGLAIDKPTGGQYNSTYVSYCNACFIQNSLGELRTTLVQLSDSYSESVERFNIYASKWGIAPDPLSANATSVGNLTNQLFSMSLAQIKSYVYTFANGKKNIVLFNDFVPYRILPSTSSSAQASLSYNLDTIFSQAIIMIEEGNSPTSSSNLFAVADVTLELVASGIQVNQLLGLYNNLRKANVGFLFTSMSASGIINKQATLSQSTLLSSNDSLSFTNNAKAYNSDQMVGLSQLQGTAQVQRVLDAFTKSIQTDYVTQAIQDSPGQDGINDSGQIKDYGSPYIRRLFYDAASVFNSIYTDLFRIMQSIVCGEGSMYVPSPNDPLDMMWFRYTVQNWQNPFKGVQDYKPKTDGADGRNSYICAGYREGPLHRDKIRAVLAAFDALINTDPITKYPGIYPRIMSLLDYVASYNNIISKVYSDGRLGSTGLLVQNQLRMKLSNRYLRLGQNNQYMDLTSLCAAPYQHFHINLPLNVPVYVISDQNSMAFQNNISRMSISSIADLGKWLSRNIVSDPNYTKFKHEIATAFIFKSVWDMIWWPQFCYEYYYRDNVDWGARLHRFNNSNANVNILVGMGSGYPVRALAILSKELGDYRVNCSFFKGSIGSNSERAVCPNLDALRTQQGDISSTNGSIMWKSMCYSYQHDALIPYLFFTSTIGGLPSNYSSITYSDYSLANGRDYYMRNSSYSVPDRLWYEARMNNDSYSSYNKGGSMLSSYEWLSSKTCIGGAALPPQMMEGVSSTMAPLLQTYAKFVNTDKAKMRQQFFADPMSWFDTSRAYQIYPLTFASYPQNITYDASYSPWIYQNIAPIQQNWQCTIGGQIYYVDTLYKFNQLIEPSYLNPSNAYAPMIDISMVTS